MHVFPFKTDGTLEEACNSFSRQTSTHNVDWTSMSSIAMTRHSRNIASHSHCFCCVEYIYPAVFTSHFAQRTNTFFSLNQNATTKTKTKLQQHISLNQIATTHFSQPKCNNQHQHHHPTNKTKRRFHSQRQCSKNRCGCTRLFR